MDIDDRICIARAKHELELELAERRLELMQLRAQMDKEEELVKSRAQESVLIKHEHELMVTNYRLRLAQEDFKQAEAKHQLEIELPARIEALSIVRSANIRSKKEMIHLDARVFATRELARAHLALDQAEALAASRGLKSIARAWNEYLNVLIVDRLSGHLLQVIASIMKVDSDFRVKLHRPLKLIRFSRKSRSRKNCTSDNSHRLT